MVDQAWEQKVGLSLTKQGLVYAAVPLIVMAMIVYPLMDCATGHHHCVFQHDAKGLYSLCTPLDQPVIDESQPVQFPERKMPLDIH